MQNCFEKIPKEINDWPVFRPSDRLSGDKQYCQDAILRLYNTYDKTIYREDFCDTVFVIFGGKIRSCEKSAGPVNCSVHLSADST